MSTPAANAGKSGDQAVRDSVMSFLDDTFDGKTAGDTAAADAAAAAEADAAAAAEADTAAAAAVVEVKPVAQPTPVVAQPDTKVTQDGVKPFLPEDILRAAAPTATPPIDANMEDPPDPPDVKPGTKSSYAWQALKAEKKRIATELAEARAALATAKAQPVVEPEEVATLRSRLTEYEQKLGMYDLAETSEFRNRFDVPAQQTVRKGQALLQRAGKSAEEATDLMRKLSNPGLTMEQVQDLVADEPIAIQGALVNLSADLGEIQSQRMDALKSWKDTRAALKIQEQRNMEVRLAEDIEAGTRVAHERAVKEGNWMLMPSQDPEWNNQVSQRLEAVRGIVKNGRKDELLKWVMEGITAKPLRELLANAHQLAEQRKAELDKLVAKSPSLRSGGGQPTSPEGVDRSKPISPKTMIDSLFG